MFLESRKEVRLDNIYIYIYTMASSKARVAVLKSLFRELQLSNKKPLKENPVYIYAMEQTRKHQVTGMKFCRERDELFHVTDTYRCLLHSVRKHEELIERYKGAGERTIEESANIVGLGLPQVGEPLK
ncbi:DgyrCDS4729 [Dimorphilus gyrociliatus]|uniref:Protein FMC1 homolog n=1 Tax=Dimorphilus gyrociliatus TaxID=2664684 RepID=A0A7I8VK19_9ANNE|nr:DgyrCDS4729 [Dimorphilus gyrociliatus]